MFVISRYIVMLNQSETDRRELAKLLHISERQMHFVTNAQPGNGLLRIGSALIPFMNQFPKDTKMYRLMTTKPGEETAAET